MKKYGYIFFRLLAIVGSVLISFSFIRHELVLENRFLLGFILALIGIIGWNWQDQARKTDNKKNIIY